MSISSITTSSKERVCLRNQADKMSTALGNGCCSDATGKNEIVRDVELWFHDYGSAFADLAAKRRFDTSILLDFYEAPVRVLGADTAILMKSPEDIVGGDGVGGQIQRLGLDGLIASTVTGVSVAPINPRAAIVEASWRRDYASSSESAFKAVYLLVRSTKGWRITSVMERADHALKFVGSVKTSEKPASEDV